MMEIKFRAWVPSDKAMIAHREVIERAHLQFDESLNHSDIVMQFTGLYDKNGKEIYEGDVYKSLTGNYYIVYFQDCCFYGGRNYSQGLPLTFNGNYFDSKWISEQIEVIGNIYENPELI